MCVTYRGFHLAGIDSTVHSQDVEPGTEIGNSWGEGGGRGILSVKRQEVLTVILNFANDEMLMQQRRIYICRLYKQDKYSFLIRDFRFFLNLVSKNWD